MQTTGSKLRGIQGKNFEIQLEYTKDFVAIHIPVVDKFTLDTLKEMKYMLEDWVAFFKTVGYQGIYAVVGIHNSRITKLAQMAGFKVVGVTHEATVFLYTGEEK